MNRPHWTYWDREDWSEFCKWKKDDLNTWLIHKLGGQTEQDVRELFRIEEKRWREIILNPEKLKLEQALARALNKIKTDMEKKFIYGTGSVKKKMIGLKAFVGGDK